MVRGRVDVIGLYVHEDEVLSRLRRIGHVRSVNGRETRAIESNPTRRESGRAGREGEDRGRRQERTNEGEGHIYRFPGVREKRKSSSIVNKFIIPELRCAIEPVRLVE
jgi:hypothetical protein